MTLFSNIVQVIKRDRLALACLSLFSIVCLIGIIAPIISPFDPYETNFLNSLKPPGGDHILGTDRIGRDLLSRIIWGARISIIAGLFPVSIATLIGTVLGITSGYFGGKVDEIIMRTMDIMLSFPYFLLCILIVAVLGPSLFNAMLSMAISMIPGYTRMIRGSVLSIKEEIFVLAAKMMGAKDIRVMFRHILPNLTSTIVTVSTLRLAKSILGVASLSFIGFGAQPPTPEWGLMISEVQGYMLAAPHVAIYPGIAIILVVLSLNILGDSLRDALDPKFRRRLNYE